VLGAKGSNLHRFQHSTLENQTGLRQHYSIAASLAQTLVVPGFAQAMLKSRVGDATYILR